MEPVKLYDAEGRSVTVRSAVEATNLRSSGYRDTPPAAIEVPADDPLAGAVQYDPAEHSIDEVKAFLAEHPDVTEAVLESERQGKNRVGLVGRQLSGAQDGDQADDTGDQAEEEHDLQEQQA